MFPGIQPFLNGDELSLCHFQMPLERSFLRGLILLALEFDDA
jgi:hypothetical protein